MAMAHLGVFITSNTVQYDREIIITGSHLQQVVNITLPGDNDFELIASPILHFMSLC